MPSGLAADGRKSPDLITTADHNILADAKFEGPCWQAGKCLGRLRKTVHLLKRRGLIVEGSRSDLEWNKKEHWAERIFGDP